MDEDELRRWVGKRLKQDVPDAIWTLVRRHSYANVQNETERLDLLTFVRKELKSLAADEMNPPRDSRSQERSVPIAPVLSSRELGRARALTEYHGKLAAGLPEVRRFRNDVLEGRAMAKTAAVKFLKSPVAALFGLAAFKEHSIPARHRTKEVDFSDLNGLMKVTIQVDPPGVSLDYEGEDLAPYHVDARGPINTDFVVRHGGRKHRITCRRGSLLDLLRVTAGSLNRYPWPEGAGAWFLLTGEAPAIDPVLARMNVRMDSLSERAQIFMEIDAWVSAATVAKMYHRAQQRFLGRHNHPVSERRIELFRFITAAMNEDGGIPPWRGQMDAWNVKFEEWWYKDVRNFSRDYRSIRETLLNPEINVS